LQRVLDKRQDDLTVIFENVNDPHNIAAVLRTCDAVGISEVYVLNTRENKHKRFSRTASSSANKWIKVHSFSEVKSCFEAVRLKYPTIYSTHLGEDSKDLYDLNLTAPTALVFGNEKDGVSADCLPYCDGNFIIPQVGMIESLNISVACAVSVYEAFRQKRLQHHYNASRLKEASRQQIMEHWGVQKP